MFLSKLWSGQRWTDPEQEATTASPPQEDDDRSLLWTLSLTANKEYPSAFGAAARLNEEGACAPPQVLHGTWDADNNSVRLVCASLEVASQVCTYEGVLTSQQQEGEEEAESFVIRGRFSEADGRKGRFLVCCEKEDPALHLSGLWLGQAVPDESLVAFAIPTNPIRWTLSVLKASASSSTSASPGRASEVHRPKAIIFGAGYFDDAADVPGQPLLFYTLHGTENQQGKVKLLKKYDTSSAAAAAETAAYTVAYEGVLTQELSEGTKEKIVKQEEEEEEQDQRATAKGGWCFSGQWSNAAAGSFGQFQCYIEAASAFTSGHSSGFCRVCHRPMRPGETRYSCLDCLNEPWTSCQACWEETSSGGSSHEHPSHHRMEAEVVLSADAAQGETCAEIAADALTRFSSRPFLGTRYDKSSPSFSWLSYEEVGDAAFALAAALAHRSSAQSAPSSSSRLSFVIIADLSPAYVYGLLGGLMAGYTLVPLHGALEPSTIARCLKLAQPVAVLIAGLEYVHKAEKAVSQAGIEVPLAVFIEESIPSSSSTTVDSSLFAIGTNRLLEEGRLLRRMSRPVGPYHAVEPPKDDQLAAILFTSGSSGEPKGAAYTEALLRPSKGVSHVVPLVKLDIQPFHPSFLLSLISVMHAGGRRAFCTDLGCLLEDACIARPTHINAPPVFWTMLQREHAHRLAEALAHNDALPLQSRRTRAQLQKEVSQQVRALLGNRLVAVAAGGAAPSPMTLRFVREELGLKLEDLYGSRETAGITRDGMIYPGVEVRLLPVEGAPEYDPSGNPPRGEIAVHTKRLISGYHNDDVATRAAFVEIDGKRFYRTGDIGEMPDAGRVHVIDRCGAVVKLAQSEWLAPSRVETVLESSPLVEQAFVYASPGRYHPVAVIVPDAHSCGSSSEEALKSLLLQEVRFWCTHHHLRPYEVPQDVVIEHNQWTPENGFLTSTMKKRRRVLTQAYQSKCDALYAEQHNRTTGERIANSNNESFDCSYCSEFLALLERVLDAQVIASLKVEAEKGNTTITLHEVGADSMAAARMAFLLTERNVPVTARTIHNYPLQHLNAMLTRASHSQSIPPLFLPQTTSEHSPLDWQAEQQLPPEFASITTKRKPARREGDILITGGTGFLGPHLVAAVLSALRREPIASSSAAGASSRRVFVLVRGPSVEAARERLLRDLKASGLLSEEVQEETSSRLIVLKGDASEDCLGLSPSQWTLLSENLSDIYHSAAKVDIMLPYKTLRKVNVGGTLTLIRLALAAGATFHYISSAAAICSNSAAEELLFHSSSSSACPSPLSSLARSLDAAELSAKSGYGATKAISESLLRQASCLYGLYVRIYRPSAICGEASGRAPWNKNDFSFLLLEAFARLGLYVTPAPARLHWVPVDWVVSAVVRLAAATSIQADGKGEEEWPHFAVFNMCGDGPTIEEAGAALHEQGIAVEAISPAQWPSAVAALDLDCRVAVLAEDLSKLEFGDSRSTNSSSVEASNNKTERHSSIPTLRTREALARLGLAWPSITPQLLLACAKWVQQETSI